VALESRERKRVHTTLLAKRTQEQVKVSEVVGTRERLLYTDRETERSHVKTDGEFDQVFLGWNFCLLSSSFMYDSSLIVFLFLALNTSLSLSYVLTTSTFSLFSSLHKLFHTRSFSFSLTHAILCMV